MLFLLSRPLATEAPLVLMPLVRSFLLRLVPLVLLFIQGRILSAIYLCQGAYVSVHFLLIFPLLSTHPTFLICTYSTLNTLHQSLAYRYLSRGILPSISYRTMIFPRLRLPLSIFPLLLVVL
jgi:hypothetical protein